jgi:hypothetical protein
MEPGSTWGRMEKKCKLGDVRVEAVNRMLNIVHVWEACHADPSELLFP